jgi:hypothetical protein
MKRARRKDAGDGGSVISRTERDGRAARLVRSNDHLASGDHALPWRELIAGLELQSERAAKRVSVSSHIARRGRHESFSSTSVPVS